MMTEGAICPKSQTLNLINPLTADQESQTREGKDMSGHTVDKG